MEVLKHLEGDLVIMPRPSSLEVSGTLLSSARLGGGVLNEQSTKFELVIH